MPEYLAPGVYIEEVSTGPRPIEGVSTSTAGFVGETERGPTHPVLVTSCSNYYQWFGGSVRPNPGTPNLFLSSAVRGFVANGGHTVFDAAFTAPAPVASSLHLPNCA